MEKENKSFKESSNLSDIGTFKKKKVVKREQEKSIKVSFDDIWRKISKKSSDDREHV